MTPVTVSLKITDATGREVREISGPVLASSNKAGIQSACWDLRVQPAPAPVATGRGGGRGDQGGGGGRQGGPGGQQQSPFGAGCGGAGGGAGGGGGGGGGFGGGGGNAGPYVLPGTYNVSLLVDGKVVDTKPLRVSADPEVILTDAQRKQLFDMAMEMHELQKRATDIGNALGPLTTRMGELSKEIDGKSDMPPDVKTMFDDVNKELGVLAPKFAPPQGGRGGRGGGGGAADNPIARVGLARNAFMAGMWPTQAAMQAYTDAKAQAPKLFAEANTLLTKASTLSSALAKHNLTLTVPPPVPLK